MPIQPIVFPSLTANEAADLNARLAALQARCDALVAITQAQAAGIPTVVGPVLSLTVSADGGANLASGLILSGQTNQAGASTGTLTNAPAGTNPNFWIPVNVNGVLRKVPAW